MKRGPFPTWPAFPTSEYYDPLRLPLDRPLHFPGSPVIGQASLPTAPQAAGAETALPGSHDNHSHVQRPIRRRVPQRPLLEQERLPWPSPSIHRLGTLYSPPKQGPLDDAYSGFTHVADRAIAPPRFAPDLSTTHGDIATGDPGVSPDRTHTGRPS